MAALLLLATCAVACTGLFTTPIGKILANPRDYDGKTVTISGEVKSSANVLVFKGYTVRDGTGEILVLTNRGVPKKGDSIRLTGVVEQAFSMGDKSVVVIRESGSG
jgi:hypothetical protein